MAKAQSIDYADAIVSLLRVDPELATGLRTIDLDRVSSLLKSLIIITEPLNKVSRLANPLGWLTAFVQARGQDEIWKDYRPVVEALHET